MVDEDNTNRIEKSWFSILSRLVKLKSKIQIVSSPLLDSLKELLAIKNSIKRNELHREEEKKKAKRTRTE